MQPDIIQVVCGSNTNEKLTELADVKDLWRNQLRLAEEVINQC